LKTSLAPDQALFRAECQIFKRSAGRSSTAAAAYRSAGRIEDRRTGEVFDYRRKHCVSSFIMAPANAPAWSQDREELWNRVEASEKRHDAQVAREWLITIPRDLPQDQWESFAREVVTPWVDAGAVVDVAVHCSLDMYGQPQPHLHIMVTLRELDPSTETGFAKKKNATLEAMHASGGRYGGERGDALKIQRERIADVMNTHLERANSPRRVSHLSNSARGIDHEPEPTMGEGRIHASKKRRKGDRVTNGVVAIRKGKALHHELTQQLQTVEEEIMSEFPRAQSDPNGAKPKHQQSYKARLMSERLSGVSFDQEQLYMIDVKDPKTTKIQMRDSGWVEVEHAARKVTVFGTKGAADKLAAAIINADHADYLERLPETAILTKDGKKPRLRKPAPTNIDADPQDIPAEWRIPETVVESLADKWRSRGFHNVLSAPDGCYINIAGTRIHDLGNEVRLHGKVSDPACGALVAKAVEEWDGQIDAFGSVAFKDQLWLEAMRQSEGLEKPVQVYDKDTGKLYEPTPELKAQWEADLAKVNEQTMNLDGVKERKRLSTLMLEAATADEEALTALRERDPALFVYLTEFLDDEQVQSLRHERAEDLEPQLEGFRALGQELAEESKGRATTTPTIAPRPVEPEPEPTKAPAFR